MAEAGSTIPTFTTWKATGCCGQWRGAGPSPPTPGLQTRFLLLLSAPPTPHPPGAPGAKRGRSPSCPWGRAGLRGPLPGWSAAAQVTVRDPLQAAWETPFSGSALATPRSQNEGTGPQVPALWPGVRTRGPRRGWGAPSPTAQPLGSHSGALPAGSLCDWPCVDPVREGVPDTGGGAPSSRVGSAWTTPGGCHADPARLRGS